MRLLTNLIALGLVSTSLVQAGHANPARLDRRATSAAQPWAQCGGRSFKGSTTCVDGWSCVTANEFYSQCVQVQGSKSSSTQAASTIASTVAATKAVTKTTSKATSKSTAASSSTKSSAAPAQTSSSPVSSSKGPIGYASLNGAFLLPASTIRRVAH